MLSTLVASQAADRVAAPVKLLPGVSRLEPRQAHWWSCAASPATGCAISDCMICGLFVHLLPGAHCCAGRQGALLQHCCPRPAQAADLEALHLPCSSLPKLQAKRRSCAAGGRQHSPSLIYPLQLQAGASRRFPLQMQPRLTLSSRLPRSSCIVKLVSVCWLRTGRLSCVSVFRTLARSCSACAACSAASC